MRKRLIWLAIPFASFVIAYFILRARMIKSADVGQVRMLPSPELIVTTQPAFWPFTHMVPLEVPTYNELQLQGLFPQFRHASFDSSGFCPVQLPFLYLDPDAVGDTAEANAFAFLLSGDLDWAPGNYCARHAYFVFKRDQAGIRELTSHYDSAQIAALVRDWSGTHAVGGTLIRSKVGCTGELDVFDRAGKVVFKNTYDSPRDYFQLLGDMDVDAMKFFGSPPNANLSTLLHAPRCNSPESIIKLGMAAFLPERSNAEFQLYSDILASDPDFAEVRYWWANQKWWHLYDNSDCQRELGTALRSRIVPAALLEFSPSQCRDQQLAGLYPSWVAAAGQLGGADSPLAIQPHMATDGRRDFPVDWVNPAEQAAASYPNDYNLLDDLSNTLLQNSNGPVDAQLAASVSLAAANDYYLPGIGRKSIAYRLLAGALATLGRPDLGLAAFARSGPADDSWWLNWQCVQFSMLGRFDDILQLFLAHPKIRHDAQSTETAMEAAFAAIVLSDSKDETKIESDWSGEFQETGFAVLLQAYRDAMAGRRVAERFLRQQFFDHLSEPGTRPRVLLLCQLDLMHRSPCCQDIIVHECAENPWDRVLWKIFDAYDRENPTAADASFYQALQDQFPDDPWVVQAVADRKKRAPLPPASAESDAAVRQFLGDFEPLDTPTANILKLASAYQALTTLVNPWDTDELIRHELDAGDAALAHQTALRYQNLAVQSRSYSIRAWAGMLVRQTAMAAGPAH